VPPRHALIVSFLYDVWDPDAVTALLGRLSPEAVCIIHVSPSHAALPTQKEEWYGTAHTISHISDGLLSRLRSPQRPPELRWPSPNDFIPTRFELLCDDTLPTDAEPPPPPPLPPTPLPPSDALRAALAARGRVDPPSLLRDDPHCEVWHKLDRTFRRPKTNLYLDIVAPAAYESPSNAMLLQLSLRLVTDDLVE
jgi:secreted Zn-dependent insulinase-like peptidase